MKFKENILKEKLFSKKVILRNFFLKCKFCKRIKIKIYRNFLKKKLKKLLWKSKILQKGLFQRNFLKNQML